MGSLNRIMRVVLIPVLISTQPVWSAGQMSPADQFARTISSFHSPDDVWRLMIRANVSTEALRAIQDDVAKQVAGSAFPTFRMVANSLFVNGKNSGIKIVSYQPLNIEYQGRTWALDSTRAMDQNYFSLLQFLRGKTPVSIIDILFPKANAFLLPAAVGWLLIAIVGAGVFSYVMNAGYDNNARQALEAIASRDWTLNCNAPDRVVLNMNKRTDAGVIEITFLKKPGSKACGIPVHPKVDNNAQGDSCSESLVEQIKGLTGSEPKQSDKDMLQDIVDCKPDAAKEAAGDLQRRIQNHNSGGQKDATDPRKVIN